MYWFLDTFIPHFPDTKLLTYFILSDYFKYKYSFSLNICWPRWTILLGHTIQSLIKILTSPACHGFGKKQGLYTLALILHAKPLVRATGRVVKYSISLNTSWLTQTMYHIPTFFEYFISWLTNSTWSSLKSPSLDGKWLCFTWPPSQLGHFEAT